MIALLLAACQPDPVPTDTAVDSDSDTDAPAPVFAPVACGVADPEPGDGVYRLGTVSRLCDTFPRGNYRFGFAVSAVNRRVVATMPGNGSEAFPSGAALYEADSGGTWSRIGTLTSGVGMDDFGLAAAMDASGEYVAIGVNATTSGDAFVYPFGSGAQDLTDAVFTVHEDGDPAYYQWLMGMAVGWLDADLDGSLDVVVGATGPQHSGGYLYVYSMGESEHLGIEDWSARVVGPDGPGEYDGGYLGSSLATGGDFDGDGIDDVLVGAPLAWAHGTRGWGSAHVFCAPLVGEVSISSACGTLRGEAEADHAGMSLDFVGDLNGDLADEIVIGAHWVTAHGEGTGRVYGVYGGERFGERSLVDADFVFTGERAWSGTGVSVAGKFDFNGDGQMDLAVGAPGDLRNLVEVGRVYVFLGPLAGELRAEDAIVLVGNHPGDMAGYALAGVPDVDGDGRDELVVGAPYDQEATDGSGKVYIVHGFAP